MSQADIDEVRAIIWSMADLISQHDNNLLGDAELWAHLDRCVLEMARHAKVDHLTHPDAGSKGRRRP